MTNMSETTGLCCVSSGENERRPRHMLKHRDDDANYLSTMPGRKHVYRIKKIMMNVCHVEDGIRNNILKQCETPIVNGNQSIALLTGRNITL